MGNQLSDIVKFKDIRLKL